MFRNLPEIEVKIVRVAQFKIKPCTLCFKVCAKKPYQFIIKDDFEMLLGKTQGLPNFIK